MDAKKGEGVFGNEKVQIYKNAQGSLMIKKDGREAVLVRYIGANMTGQLPLNLSSTV